MKKLFLLFCLAGAGYIPVQACTVNLTAIPVNTTCFGSNDGIIYAWPTSGTAPFSYSIGGGFQSSGTFTGLAPGNYTVTVKDGLGCTGYQLVTISQPSAIFISPSTTPVSCNGGNNGSVTLTASGGTPYYLYSLGGGFQGSNTFNGRSAGTYTATVKDANGCTQQMNVTVSQPAAISVSANVQDVTCNGGSDGNITVITSGGTPAYIYSNGGTFQGSNSFTGIPAGSYTITVIDANGCSNQTYANIHQPSAISYSTTVVNESSSGANDGSISLSVSGGTLPYTYFWPSTNSTGSSVTGLSGGTYQCYITDAAGCVILIYVAVNTGRSFHQHENTVVNNTTTLNLYPNPASDQVSIKYTGGSTGNIVLNVCNTQGESVYNCSTTADRLNGSTIDVSGLPAGTYFLNVTGVDQPVRKIFLIQR
jgi:hypothetical protein